MHTNTKVDVSVCKCYGFKKNAKDEGRARLVKAMACPVFHKSLLIIPHVLCRHNVVVVRKFSQLGSSLPYVRRSMEL